MAPIPNIGRPAAHALKTIGITSLEQLTGVDKENLSRVHGIGPKAMDILERELERKELTFKKHEPLPFTPGFGVFGSLGCNNAPKKEILRDFAISFVEGNKNGLGMTCNEDVKFQVVKNEELRGIEEVYQYISRDKYNVSSLELKSLITHGKEAGAYGSLVTVEGEKIELAWFIHFKSHKKDALIQDISFFEVR
ncbi:hypothetical protein [Lacicoccus alkaliphilus]|uniref:Helix-hairpin-helix domain-containing protein n=1 Tax=Lacicoccus alkaliphilus DSM 16010 TaxID=1123231 RepID=A0A1M7GTX1_9BACL|nr:hypothetical protein [Salinicoccus alkaliphilus]SHM19279.1 hypothetical protein SAMN02745189_01731 [Salinicoccus alkaliphilus DSM 16010]